MFNSILSVIWRQMNLCLRTYVRDGHLLSTPSICNFCNPCNTILHPHLDVHYTFMWWILARISCSAFSQHWGVPFIRRCGLLQLSHKFWLHFRQYEVACTNFKSPPSSSIDDSHSVRCVSSFIWCSFISIKFCMKVLSANSSNPFSGKLSSFLHTGQATCSRSRQFILPLRL